MNFSHDKNLVAIAQKVEAGERLSFEDGVALFATEDLPALGKLADTIRRALAVNVDGMNPFQVVQGLTEPRVPIGQRRRAAEVNHEA